MEPCPDNHYLLDDYPEHEIGEEPDFDRDAHDPDLLPPSELFKKEVK